MSSILWHNKLFITIIPDFQLTIVIHFNSNSTF